MSQKMTVEFMSTEFEVEFTYIKAERPTFHYPGAEEEMEIRAIYHNDGCMNQFFEELELWDQLQEVVLEKYKE